MPYVEKKDGKVIGLYGAKQIGFAEELLDDNDPEVVQFREDNKRPIRISMAQARIALRRIGKLNLIAATLNTMDTSLKNELTDMLEYTSHISNKGTVVQALKTHFGFTDQDIDALFAEAETVKFD
jgi:hypothetical protein